ncbi:MAG: type I-C CRISPR-associated protein Cas5 [Ktedonobacteraceae bacterium]|nr:type I-C CRISPR-associated protein Cas5 [Ktedonobacteraceae bacterium]
MKYPAVEVYVWGKLACFTRPEMKVERVSYEVMTPSAARGVLEAIFWKPEFRWQIREIRVLKPIRYFSILRNEVNNRANYSSAQRHLKGEGGYYADEDRSQRHTLCLRDVAYIIAANVAVKPNVEEDEAKYRDQFQRRVKRGQCHSMPYLGCREFSANFGPEPPVDGDTRLQDITVDLGRMLFDLDYERDGSGRGTPRFFHAHLRGGVLQIPERLYKQGEE